MSDARVGVLTRADIVRAARGWIGTPYLHQASREAVGCDCLGLVRGVYRAVHGREPTVVPSYSPDWGEASGRETLLEAARAVLVERDVRLIEAGDVIVFRMRRGAVAKHAAVATSAQTMVHAQEGIGTVEVPISKWWQRRIAAVFSFPGIED